MVTNNVTFLPKVDKIIVIKDGQISETGTYKELLTGTGAFKNFLLQYLTTQQDIPETIMHDLEEVLDKEEQIKLRRNSAASGKTTRVNITASNQDVFLRFLKKSFSRFKHITRLSNL